MADPRPPSRPRGLHGRNASSGGPKKTVEILPDPEVLENYDYVVEGSAKMILEMFSREQAHRHAWETQALGVHMKSTILGQVLGFFIAIAVFVSASIIGIYGNQTLAATIWVFGMAIIVMAGLVWSYAKTLGSGLYSPARRCARIFRPAKEKAEEMAEAE